MLEGIRRHTPLLVAVLAVAVLAAGQAVAQPAADTTGTTGPAGVDADTVDGRHVVGPGAAPADRGGALVATTAAGYLPNDIIRKAVDADKVDGLHAAAFARAATLRASTGAVNQADNPVHWKQLKGVPTGIADGNDAVGYNSWIVFAGDTVIPPGETRTVIVPTVGRGADYLFSVIPPAAGGFLSVDDVRVLREDDGDLTYLVRVRNHSGVNASGFKVRGLAFHEDIASVASGRR
jgi:hypothetical protein